MRHLGDEEEASPMVSLPAWAVQDLGLSPCFATDFLCDLGQVPSLCSVPQFPICPTRIPALPFLPGVSEDKYSEEWEMMRWGGIVST